MELVSHLEASQVTSWHQVRPPDSLLLLAGGSPGAGGPPLLYDPGGDLWSPLQSPPLPPYPWAGAAVYGSTVFLFTRGQEGMARLELDTGLVEIQVQAAEQGSVAVAIDYQTK